MYSIYTVTPEYKLNEVIIHKMYGNLKTRKDAEQALIKRNIKTKTSKTRWFIVEDTKETKFKETIYHAFFKQMLKYVEENAIRNHRWNIAKQLYLKGYKCSDIIKFVNGED